MADLPAPSTPDPTWQALIFSLLRALVTILGTVGVTVPVLSNASVMWALAGGLAILASAVMSIVDKYQAAHKDHANSVASANAGRALTVSK